MEKERYNKLNKHLKKKFGERTLKISIDGGFTCPNRDGSKSTSGCIFCSAHGSGEHTRFHLDIPSQVKAHLASYRGMRANKFIAYFQDFTNTYADVTTLKKKYESALIDERIVGLEIATRPDCINEEIVNLLCSFNNRLPVTVELGLQSQSDEIGRFINRCYTTQDFINAVTLLHENNIEVVAHIMVGLPGQDEEEILKTVELMNSLNIDGVKIHSTYIVANSELEKLYNEKKYTPITLDYYLTMLVKIISRLNENIVIHRISGDAPKDLLVAPEWNKHKKLVLNGIEKLLKEKDIYQGDNKL